MRQASKYIIERIKSYENLSLVPYLDYGGVPTIGYGCTYYPEGIKVTMHDPKITVTRANEIFNYIIEQVESWLNMLQVQFNQNQFDACISFFFNVGWVGFKNKDPNTWKDLINSNLNKFAEDMLKFNHVNKEICKDLTNRRKWEHDLFLSNVSV